MSDLLDLNEKIFFCTALLYTKLHLIWITTLLENDKKLKPLTMGTFGTQIWCGGWVQMNNLKTLISLDKAFHYGLTY